MFVWVLTRVLLPGVMLGSGYYTIVFADLGTYQRWAAEAFAGQPPGVTTDWAYPVGSLAPIVVPGVFGGGTDRYALLFLVLACAVDAAVLVLLARRGRTSGGGLRGAWWWVVFGGLAGPVLLTRLDLPSALPALASLSAGPFAAGVLLAIGTAMKGWPVFLFPAVLAGRDIRGWWRVVCGAGAVLGAVGALLVLTRNTEHVFSFAGFQSGRLPEVESVGALPRLWTSAIRAGNTVVFGDHTQSYEVLGAGRWPAITLGLSMAVAVAVSVAGLLAARRPGQRELAIAATATGLACCALIGDKVFSAQYVVWLAVPVAWSACRPGRVRRTELAVLGIALATQVVFPFGWARLVYGGTWPLILMTFRDLLVIGCLAGTCLALVRLLTEPATTRALAGGPAGAT